MKKLATLLFFLFTVQTWAQVDVWKKQLVNTNIDTTKARLMYKIGWELKNIDPAASLAYTDSAYQIAEKNKLDKLLINCILLKARMERFFGNYDKAMEYCQSSLQLSMENSDPFLILSSIQETGNLYGNLNDFTNAHRYYDLVIKFSIQTGNVDLLMKGLSNKALIFDKQGNLEEAFKYYYQALTIGLKNGLDEEAIASTKVNLGFLYVQTGNFKAAINLLQEAAATYQKFNNQPGLANTSSTLATIALFSGNFEQALLGYQASLKINEQLHNIGGIQADYSNIAGLLGNMGRFNESLAWLKKGMELAKKMDDKRVIATSYTNLSDVYLMMGDFSKAVQYGDSAKYAMVEVGISGGDLRHVYNNLVQAYKGMHNYKEAFENYEQFTVVSDSIYTLEVEREANELKIQYGVEVQKKQFELLKEQDKVRILQVKQKNYLIAGLIGGILTFIGLVVVIFFILISRSQKKEAVFARKRAELEQQALRSQMNPHFIFNSLNSIQRLYVEGKTDKANEYMADFSTLMRKILDNSTRNKITVKEELNTLQLYLEMEKLRCGDLLEYHISIDPTIDPLNTLIPPMVIQPFVENAIWHGILPKKVKGTVKIQLQKAGQGLICIIEDDGVGLSNKTGTHQPMGIKLTEQRLKTKVKVENLSPGTRISFTVYP